MSSLVGSLMSINGDIQRQGIFKAKSFLLPPNLKPVDINAVSKSLSKKIHIESVVLEQSIEEKKRDIQSATESLRCTKQMVRDYEARLQAMLVKNDSDEISKSLKKIINSLPIEHVEFVDPAVTIFTTSVFKKSDKIMGAYRIWIDWNYRNYSHAMRVVNITHDSGSHPHPCVASDGHICEGNAASTFKKYYEEKDVYSLLESIIGFLLSDDIRAGYISSWNRFFEQLNNVNPAEVFSSRSIVPASRAVI